jgi:type I restriction enzyme S subunit
MNYVKLDKFVELSQGLCVNQKTSNLFSESQNDDFIYPLLKIANMQENKFNIYVSKDVNKKVIAQEDDLIYTRTGLVGYCFKGFNGVVHNNSFIINITKPLELNKNYLYIILNTDFVKNQALKMARTSVQPDLTHEMFKSILIPLPDIKTQIKIANHIMNIDNQIERNNTMVQKLQDLAQTTYSRWFNQFEYPNNNEEKIFKP